MRKLSIITGLKGWDSGNCVLYTSKNCRCAKKINNEFPSEFQFSYLTPSSPIGTLSIDGKNYTVFRQSGTIYIVFENRGYNLSQLKGFADSLCPNTAPSRPTLEMVLRSMPDYIKNDSVNLPQSLTQETTAIDQKGNIVENPQNVNIIKKGNITKAETPKPAQEDKKNNNFLYAAIAIGVTAIGTVFFISQNRKNGN